MITAKEARKATEDRLNRINKEFVINEVDKQIRKAIDAGRYYTVVDLVDLDLPNLEDAGSAIVTILKDYGFEAEFTYVDENTRYEAYINIKWEKCI